MVAFRAPRRQGPVPSTAPYNPTTVTIGGTVSTTGSGISNPTTSGTFVTNQVTVTSGGAPTLLFAQSASIIFREVTNPTSSNAAVFLGLVGVTVTTGHYLPGATAFDQGNNSAALYGLAATGSVTVSTIGW